MPCPVQITRAPHTERKKETTSNLATLNSELSTLDCQLLTSASLLSAGEQTRHGDQQHGANRCRRQAEQETTTEKTEPGKCLISSCLLSASLPCGSKKRATCVQAGCCCVMQWSVPSPSTRSLEAIPITSRSGNKPASVSSAMRSFGSLNVGTSTSLFAI